MHYSTLGCDRCFGSSRDEPCEHREAYQRGLAEGRKEITRGHYQNGYEDGRNDGIKIGRAEERAAIVAWLNGAYPVSSWDPSEAICTIKEAIERADHLRSDIKDGEGETERPGLTPCRECSGTGLSNCSELGCHSPSCSPCKTCDASGFVAALDAEPGKEEDSNG